MHMFHELPCRFLKFPGWEQNNEAYSLRALEQELDDCLEETCDAAASTYASSAQIEFVDQLQHIENEKLETFAKFYKAVWKHDLDLDALYTDEEERARKKPKLDVFSDAAACEDYDYQVFEFYSAFVHDIAINRRSRYNTSIQINALLQEIHSIVEVA